MALFFFFLKLAKCYWPKSTVYPHKRGIIKINIYYESNRTVAQIQKYQNFDTTTEVGSFNSIFMYCEDSVNVMPGDARNLGMKQITLSITVLCFLKEKLFHENFFLIVLKLLIHFNSYERAKLTLLNFIHFLPNDQPFKH